MADEKLPEGTDHVIAGASVTDDVDDAAFGTASAAEGSASGSGTSFNWGEADGFRQAFEGKAQTFFDQAGGKARDYVAEGLDRGVSALDDVIKMVNGAAETIDEKVGAQYGDYARKASDAIAGLADTLRAKDADTLFADARDAVKKSPAIAIGAAAALGFVVARIIKAGMPASTATKAPSLAEDDPIIPVA